MAAVLAPHPTRTAARPALRLVAPVGAARPRAVPRSVTPPPRYRPSPVTFWRRRVVLLLLVTSVALLAHLVVSSVLDRPRDVSVVTAPVAAVDPGAGPEAAAPPAGDAPAAVYVVRPGDTVWSIASTLQPDGDVRDLVDRLTERAGGSALQAGQRIALDGLEG